MHGIFWMVIGHSGTCQRGTQPHCNGRHFLDGNRPLWYMLPWYLAPTVMHGMFWMVIGHSGTFYCGIQPPRQCMVYFIFLRVTPACVWCCDARTFTEHENHQTSNLNMKYSGEDNKRQCPDHRQTFAANRQRSQARGMPSDVICFITRPKPF